MSDTLFANLFRVLGLAVIERLPNAAFHPLTPSPDWLSAVFDAAQSGARNSLGGAFPFLDHFLPRAEAAWNDGPRASADSGLFAATVGGEELLLRATAVTVDERKLLVIEQMTGDADSRPLLQRAREQQLEHERLMRQISTAQAPAAAVREGLLQLQDTPLAPEQLTIVERVLRAGDDLQSAMAVLPSAPHRLRRQARPR